LLARERRAREIQIRREFPALIESGQREIEHNKSEVEQGGRAYAGAEAA